MLFCGGWVGVSFINIMSIWQASLILNTQFIVFSIFTELCNRCCCSVTQLCSTLCDPMDCSTLGFPALHYLPGFAQTHVHWVSDAIQPSHPLSSPSPPALNLSQQQGLFPMSQLFASDGLSIRALASVFPMNIQSWFPLGLTGLISLLSKGFSRVFTNTTVRWYQRSTFFVV